MLVVSVKMRKTLYRTASQKKAALTTTPGLSTQIKEGFRPNCRKTRTIIAQLVSISAAKSGHGQLLDCVCYLDLPLTRQRDNIQMIYSKWQWGSISHNGEAYSYSPVDISTLQDSLMRNKNGFLYWYAVPFLHMVTDILKNVLLMTIWYVVICGWKILSEFHLYDMLTLWTEFLLE